jgi:hypothetical protein
MEDILLAKAVVEDSKDEEMATAVVGTVIKMLDKIFSNLRCPKQNCSPGTATYTSKQGNPGEPS